MNFPPHSSSYRASSSSGGFEDLPASSTDALERTLRTRCEQFVALKNREHAEARHELLQGSVVFAPRPCTGDEQQAFQDQALRFTRRGLAPAWNVHVLPDTLEALNQCQAALPAHTLESILRWLVQPGLNLYLQARSALPQLLTQLELLGRVAPGGLPSPGGWVALFLASRYLDSRAIGNERFLRLLEPHAEHVDWISYFSLEHKEFAKTLQHWRLLKPAPGSDRARLLEHVLTCMANCVPVWPSAAAPQERHHRIRMFLSVLPVSPAGCHLANRLLAHWGQPDPVGVVDEETMQNAMFRSTLQPAATPTTMFCVCSGLHSPALTQLAILNACSWMDVGGQSLLEVQGATGNTIEAARTFLPDFEVRQLRRGTFILTRIDAAAETGSGPASPSP